MIPLGQRVRVRPEFPFYEDFKDEVFTVVGLRLVCGGTDIEIASARELRNGDYGTDGFCEADLEPV